MATERAEQGSTAAARERRLIHDEVVRLHRWLTESAARRHGSGGEHDELPVLRLIHMHGLLRRHLRDHGWSVRPPRSTQEAADVLRGTVPGLAQELGREPTIDEVAECLGWTREAIDDARRAGRGLQPASAEALVGDACVSAHPPGWNLVEIRALLHQAVQGLTEAERDLLRMRFLEEMTQSQIAAVTGVTHLQVSRLLARLMARLRSRIGELEETPTGR